MNTSESERDSLSSDSTGSRSTNTSSLSVSSSDDNSMDTTRSFSTASTHLSYVDGPTTASSSMSQSTNTSSSQSATSSEAGSLDSNDSHDATDDQISEFDELLGGGARVAMPLRVVSTNEVKSGYGSRILDCLIKCCRRRKKWDSRLDEHVTTCMCDAAIKRKADLIRRQLKELNTNLTITLKAKSRYANLAGARSPMINAGNVSFTQWYKAHEDWIETCVAQVPAEIEELEGQLLELGE